MAQQQQYSYGYGYQPTYPYAQPAQPATPTGYVGYAAPRPAYTPTPPAAPSQPAIQQPNVGYSPYSGQNTASPYPAQQNTASPYSGQTAATPQNTAPPAPYSGQTSATPQNTAPPAPYSGQTSATPAPYSGQTSATPAPYSGQTSATPAPYSGQTSGTPAPYSGQTSATPAPYSGQTSATPAPYSGQNTYSAQNTSYGAQNTQSNQGYVAPQASSAPTYGQDSTKYQASQASPAPYSQGQTPSYHSASAYKPQTPSYTPYYEGVRSKTTPSYDSATKPPPVAASSATTYVPTYTLTSSASSSSAVGYPSSYSQSSYASAANAYYKQIKEGKTTTFGTAASSSNENLTPVQQQVVQNYISQKNQGSTYGGGYNKRKNYTPSQPVQSHYCEVCKISCASALTYQTHLDGKNHKKKVQKQESGPSKDNSQHAFFCELCDVVCSSKDGLEAHVRGAKHTKVVNLFKKMGKPIPEPKFSLPSGKSSGTAQKPVMVTAPRIKFVGGKKLSSTAVGYQEASVDVYSGSSATEEAAATEEDSGTAGMETNGDATAEQTDTPAVPEKEPEPVGEHLVIAVSNDPKFPHASYKCELCDCYFNDEYARKAHVKGRRHRLNYKKTHDPSLYVEPTKAMKKDHEKKKKQRQQQREMISELQMMAGSARGRGGRGRGGRGGFYPLGNYSSHWGGGDFGAQGRGMHVNERRRQEVLDHARHEQMMRDEGMMFPPGPMPPHPHMRGPMQPVPRNHHDDKLIVNKHSSIHPTEQELTAIDTVVDDVEKVLKFVSDDLMVEECKVSKTNKSGDKDEKDESKRVLKGVMRVGSFARGLLLKGECHVELILMSANKPDITLFQSLDTRIPAKFEELKKSGVIKRVYNVTPNCTKAIFTIISQVEKFCVKVTVTLTSTTMRDEPTPEQAKTDEDEGVLDRSSCLVALAALRHTKWFQAMAHSLPSCIVVLRVLKDICRRVPAWGVLDSWILQLLVQKCIVSANSDFTKPGDVFRRVMECVASGLFLPGGLGLADPCEKGVVDASANLTAQERANITLSAQHALRLIAFDKLYLVLGVDPLDEDNDPSLGTKRDAGSLGSVDNCKKIKLE